jgi:hypothetical protein
MVFVGSQAKACVKPLLPASSPSLPPFRHTVLTINTSLCSLRSVCSKHVPPRNQRWELSGDMVNKSQTTIGVCRVVCMCGVWQRRLGGGGHCAPCRYHGDHVFVQCIGTGGRGMCSLPDLNDVLSRSSRVCLKGGRLGKLAGSNSSGPHVP